LALHMMMAVEGTASTIMSLHLQFLLVRPEFKWLYIRCVGILLLLKPTIWLGLVCLCLLIQHSIHILDPKYVVGIKFWHTINQILICISYILPTLLNLCMSVLWNPKIAVP
jgi:hypothetical protein